MKTWHIVALGAGVLVVGFVGYAVYRANSLPTSYKPSGPVERLVDKVNQLVTSGKEALGFVKDIQQVGNTFGTSKKSFDVSDKFLDELGTV